MSTEVENRNAIEATDKTKFAIFIKNINGQRYAFNSDNGGFTNNTFKEVNGKWEHHDECLVTWAIWNADFQGFDDLTSLIK